MQITCRRSPPLNSVIGADMAKLGGVIAEVKHALQQGEGRKAA